MRKAKKVTALFLTVLMIAQIFSVSGYHVSAEDSIIEPESQQIPENEDSEEFISELEFTEETSTDTFNDDGEPEEIPSTEEYIEDDNELSENPETETEFEETRFEETQESDETIERTAEEEFEEILALMMLMEGTDYSSELRNFLIGVVIKDSDGNPMESDNEFILGENYTFILTFKEEDFGLQFNYDNDGVLTYQLPAEIVIPQELVGSHDILGEGDAVVGKYSIVADGAITVWFKDIKIDGTSTPDTNFIDNYINASFTLEISAQLQNITSGDDLDFSDNIKITVTVDETAQLDVKKTSTGYNPTAQTIEYTIEVTAYGQDISNIVLTDVPVLTGNFVDDNLDIENLIKSNATLTINRINGDTSEESEIMPDWDSDTKKFTFSLDNITLNPGDKAVITYTVDLSEWVKDNPKISGNLNNTVTATGKDLENNVIVGHDDENTEIKREFLIKGGWFHYGDTENDHYIVWDNVFVGDGYTNLVGATITDTLGVGLEFIENIEVKVNGNTVHYVNPNEEGTAFSYYVSAENFPEGIYKIQFYYKTKITNYDSTKATTYDNTIAITRDNDFNYSHTGTVTVNPEGGATIKKESKLIQENGEDYIEYTIKCFIPESLYGIPLWVEDHLGITMPNGWYYRVENNPIDITITAVNEYGDIPLVENIDYGIFYSDSPDAQGYVNKYSWYLHFAPGKTYGECFWDGKSLSPFKNDTTITIKYRISLDAELIPEDTKPEPPATLRDAFDYSIEWGESGYSILSNNAQMQFKDHFRTIESQTNDRWPIHKVGQWIEDDDYHSNTFKYQIYISAKEMAECDSIPTFIDVFDSRLKYVDYSFSLQIWGGGRSDYYIAYDSDQTSTEYITATDNSIEVNFDNENFWKVESWDPFTTAPADTNWYKNTNPDKSTYLITYYLEYDGDIPEYEIELENEATITYTKNGEEYSYSDDFTLKHGSPVVDKTMEYSGNTATVEILINPDGLTLPEGEGAAPDTITVTDVMSETLAFYINSIKVYKEIPGDWEEQTLTLGGTGAYSYTTEGDNKITFILPNETSLKIVYKALIKGQTGETVDIQNSVSVNGQWEKVVGTKFEVANTSGSAGGDKEALTIIKEDASDSSKKLKDAKFELYVYHYIDGAESKEITVNGVSLTFYYLDTLTTDENGRASYSGSSVIDGYIYALVEIEAPANYTLLNEPILFYYSWDKLTPEEQEAISADGTITQISDNIIVKNTPYGSKFPHTGGEGIAIFITSGLFLMSLSAVLLCRYNRKMKFKLKK